MPGRGKVVSGPIPMARNDGLRAARGLSVIENPPDPEDPNREWVRGYRFMYGPCGAGFTADPCEHEPAVPVAGPQRQRWVEPFIVIVGRTCSTWGWEAADYATEASRLLDANQYEIVARELWRGDQAIASGWTNPDPDEETGGPGNPYLTADWNTDFLNLITANGGDPAVDTMHPVEGLAALEDALAACSNTPGLIHMSRRLAVILTSYQVVRADGGRLFTSVGTQVVADRGYDGSAPDSLGKTPASADREWLYATGSVTLRTEQGAPFLTPAADRFEEAVDRAENNITFLAQRKASVSWGCCHIGVAVVPFAAGCIVPADEESS